MIVQLLFYTLIDALDAPNGFISHEVLVADCLLWMKRLWIIKGLLLFC